MWWGFHKKNLKRVKVWVFFLIYLNTASQHLIEDVSSFLHDADVVQRGVSALAILDGINEAVSELFDGTKQILLDEVHHAVVWGGEESRKFKRFKGELVEKTGRVSIQLSSLTFNKVVLQRRPSQHHPPPCPDGVHGFWDSRRFVLQDVTFVADHQVWTWSEENGAGHNMLGLHLETRDMWWHSFRQREAFVESSEVAGPSCLGQSYWVIFGWITLG